MSLLLLFNFFRTRARLKTKDSAVWAIAVSDAPVYRLKLADAAVAGATIGDSQ